MPTRPAIAVILVGWVCAATGLFRRDVLPDFRTTPPPDLRSIAGAGEDAGPTTWFLSVADDVGLRSLRPVGRAFTRTETRPDGGRTLLSEVSFESNDLFRGTPFAARFEGQGGVGHVTVSNACAIDPAGNLRHLKVKIHLTGDSAPLMTIDARVVDHFLEITTDGPIPFLNRPTRIPYEPRGIIQNGIGPTDRLPGLQVGQRWETEVVSPITGRVEKVLTEVTGKRSIQWNNILVPTLEVVQRLTPISARTWVRRDGLVLRQELPFPFVRLILERAPVNVIDAGYSGIKAP